MQQEITLKDDERLDYFHREDIHLIQSKQYFASSLDAVLLADFIEMPQKDSIHYIDFCSGNGIIPLLLSAKYAGKLQGIELQAPLVDMARRSAQLNGVSGRVDFIEGDLNDFKRPPEILYDIVSCNPPYFSMDASEDRHHLNSHALARHEVALTLEQWIHKASQIMRTKGKLFFVHRPERLDDIVPTLSKYHFGIHRMRFVHPKADRLANILLVEAIYGGGKGGIKVLPPLTVHTQDNHYTKAMMDIYYG